MRHIRGYSLTELLESLLEGRTEHTNYEAWNYAWFIRTVEDNWFANLALEAR